MGSEGHPSVLINLLRNEALSPGGQTCFIGRVVPKFVFYWSLRVLGGKGASSVTTSATVSCHFPLWLNNHFLPEDAWVNTKQTTSCLEPLSGVALPRDVCKNPLHMFPPGKTRASRHPFFESNSCKCFENNRLSLKKQQQQQKAICFFHHDWFRCCTLGGQRWGRDTVFKIVSSPRSIVNCFPWNVRPTSFICKKILFQVKIVFHQKSSPFSSHVEQPQNALPWGHPHALVWRILYILLPRSLHRMLKKHVLKGQNLTIWIIWTPPSRKSIKEPGMFFSLPVCSCEESLY